MHTVLKKEEEIAPGAHYVFDNAGERSRIRYRELSKLYDTQTIRHLRRRGVTKGWSCLEVGGGGGSIAAWMCAAVGDKGRVLATDIDPRFLQTLSFSNLEVLRHDISTDDLPKRQFELAHARLVLIHLPVRELALDRMIGSLKPGGWIVLEEFDELSLRPNEYVNPGEEELRVELAFQQVLTARGIDLRYGRRLPRQLRAHGLVNVGAEGSVSIWKGRSPGTTLFKLNYEEMREEILGLGLMSQAAFKADINRLDKRDFLMLSPIMWTAWGQVPGHPSKVGPELSKCFNGMNDISTGTALSLIEARHE